MEQSAPSSDRDAQSAATTPAAQAEPQATELAQALHDQMGPWQEAVANPLRAQEIVLRRLLQDYARTGYGSTHDAAAISPTARTGSAFFDTYRHAFPIMTYEDYKPYIDAVMAGETNLLLSEQPVGWAITRGTVEGESKFIPMTPTDLRMRVSAGRAMMAYVAATKRLDLFAGVNLNLNFPSVVGSVQVGENEVEYGYSSGIYTKHVSKFTPIRSVPVQEEIDALGGGTTRRDWTTGLSSPSTSAGTRMSRWSGASARPPLSSGAIFADATRSIPSSSGRHRS